MRVITHSEKETSAFAKKFARSLKGGDILLLKGELGSGKTTFVKGLARALKVSAKIKSPTFVLMHQHRVTGYGLRVKWFVHVDAYRVKNAQALKEIGLMEWIGRPDTIVAIEWGEKVKPLIKEKAHLTIKFQHGRKQDERTIFANF